jgi:replication fork clamp-binding protein CrfC
MQNPVGDQPKDIELQVNNLILSYISNPQAIILAVSPANADIATSDSIKFATIADPNGDRTLGVITKLDLMDKGTDATDLLDGKTLKIKLGMIGVVNRSEKDIKDQKSITDALEYEKEFIDKTYPRYKDRMGSPYLAERLNFLLKGHIAKTLPDLVVLNTYVSFLHTFKMVNDILY